MYNGIGLKTARGSGTNGFVQRNLSYIRPSRVLQFSQKQEQEIIEQAAMGKSNREIAQSLFLSEGTVRNYISAILEKLSLRDRTQLVVFYFTKIC